MKKGSTEGLHLFVENDRQQRAATVLRDVAYVIEAHFELKESAGQAESTAAKHISMFNRRAVQGQCFHRPYLGVREFAAHFAPVGEALPASSLAEHQRDCDLGWMLHDIDYERGNTPRFFRAALKEGVLEVPSLRSPEVKA